MSANISIHDRLSAVRLARRLKNRTEDEVKDALEAHGKKVGIDITLIILFIQIGLAIWKYMQSNDVSKLSNAQLLAVALPEE